MLQTATPRFAKASILPSLPVPDDVRLRQAAFRQEIEESWKHYQTTGLHVTLEELEDWSARLKAAGTHVEPPACHV
jgi:2'-5' RNA ligase